MSSKSTKWVILGCVVFVLAVLIMVAPLMVKKYMRAKWQNAPHYKTSELLMNVVGTMEISDDKTVYLKGDNGLFYVLEGIQQDVSDKKSAACTVTGAFRPANDGDMVDGNPVRMFIAVKKIKFTNSDDFVDNTQNTQKVSDTIKMTAEEKSLKKAKLRVEANLRLNKLIMFDVIKGKVSSIKRKDKSGNEYTAFILSDDMGDRHMLYKKGVDLSSLEDKNIIVLGREILPPSNIFLVVDETTFEIYEVYDENYNKLM